MTAAVLSSVSLAFSTFLIGPATAEAGPISVAVGDIAYATRVSLESVSFEIDEESLDGPDFVRDESGQDVLVGEPVFTVDVSFDHAAMDGLAYFEDVLLNIRCWLRARNGSSYCDFSSVRIGLRDYPTFYYDVPLTSGFAGGQPVSKGTFGFKSSTRPSLSDLSDMDMLYASSASGGRTYIRFSFHVLENSSNYNQNVLQNGTFSVNFSLISGD